MGKKEDRQVWEKEDMVAAIRAIKTNQMGWKLAAKTFRVPRSTLKRRVLDRNKIIKHGEKGFLGGRVSVFTPEIERELVNHIRKETEMTGWDWAHALIKRHENLISLRIPEATSLARAQGFNKPAVETFFKMLNVIILKHNFKPDQIYNMDESGFSTVQSRTEKILAVRGRKQVGTLTSAERGVHFSAVCCVNAMGNFIPPALIFPRKNMKNELMDNGPIGSVGYANETGYMTGELCLKWLQHFKQFANPSPERKILLLLDGHSSHKNLQVLEYAKSNNIILFCFPAHCTHRLQSLDVSFYAPLTTYYNQSIRSWLRAHPGRVLSHYQVGELFNEAYLKAATLGNAVSGFQKTGIVPLNENVFPDWMFSPADVTDVPPEESVSTASSKAPDEPVPDCINKDVLESEEIAIPSTSTPSCTMSEKVVEIIQKLSPLPMVENFKGKRVQRKKGKCGVINSTPEVER